VKKIAVIGGGIVGLAVAYKLGRKLPNSKIMVFEKEPEVQDIKVKIIAEYSMPGFIRNCDRK
jgi:2-polyprenyl-6-methoxyphenol hydroxylase-like FAD-dependent oxidoreductase